MDNVVVNYVNGSGLLAGASNGEVPVYNGSFKESTVQNSRFEFTGSNTASILAPAVEFTSTSSSSTTPEGSNNVNLTNVRIYQSLGPALWIHNGTGVGANTRSFRLANIKIEGSQVSLTTEGGDLLEIGDPSITSSAVSDVLCRNVDLVNPVLGYSALHVAGTPGHEAAAIDCEGAITGPGPALTATQGAGRGIEVDTCQLCGFKEALNNSGDYNLAIGVPLPGNVCTVQSATNFSVLYNGNGAEQSGGPLTKCVDPTVASAVKIPAITTLPLP